MTKHSTIERIVLGHLNNKKKFSVKRVFKLCRSDERFTYWGDVPLLSFIVGLAEVAGRGLTLQRLYAVFKQVVDPNDYVPDEKVEIVRGIHANANNSGGNLPQFGT